MIEANIREGNKVIVQFNKEPKNGDIVVAKVNDDTVVLRPANRNYEEQRYSKKSDIKIKGVVIGVLW